MMVGGRRSARRGGSRGAATPHVVYTNAQPAAAAQTTPAVGTEVWDVEEEAAAAASAARRARKAPRIKLL